MSIHSRHCPSRHPGLSQEDYGFMANSIELLSITLPETSTVRIAPNLLVEGTDESVFSTDSGGLRSSGKEKRWTRCEGELLTCVKQESEGDGAIFALSRGCQQAGGKAEAAGSPDIRYRPVGPQVR